MMRPPAAVEVLSANTAAVDGGAVRIRVSDQDERLADARDAEISPPTTTTNTTTTAPTVDGDGDGDNAESTTQLPTRKASKELIPMEEALRRQSRHRGHIVRINYQQRVGLVQAKEWPDELLPFQVDAIRVSKDDPKRKPVLYDPCDFKLSQITSQVRGPPSAAGTVPSTSPPERAESLGDAPTVVSSRFQATSVRLKHRAAQAPIGEGQQPASAEGSPDAAGSSYDPLMSPTPSSFSSFGMVTPSSFGSYTGWQGNR